MVEASEAERRFWEDEESSIGNDVIRSVRKHQVQGHPSDPDRTSSAHRPRAKYARPNKVTADKGVDTGPTPRPRNSKPAAPLPRVANSNRTIYRHTGTSSTSATAPTRSSPATLDDSPSEVDLSDPPPAYKHATGNGFNFGSDSDEDSMDVEAMVDTEGEDSPPSRGVSFTFSNVESRNGSDTSLSSSPSIDPRTGRKRTLEYTDSWKSIPGSTRKSARTAIRSEAPRSRQKTPPPRSDVASTSASATRAHLQNAVETPTLSRVCSSFQDLATDDSDIDDDPVASPGVQEPNTPIPVDVRSPPGTYIIAHSAHAQKRFDKIPLSWGVQYELARGVGNGWWTWEEVVHADLNKLAGPNNNAAARVAYVLGRTLAVAPVDPNIWSELDCEEAAIIEGKGRGLGLQGDFMGKQKWYGGKIQQVARLSEAENGSFQLTLTKMESRKSNRFARFLSSRRLLQVSIGKKLVNDRKEDVDAFFKQKFVLCGRVFVALGAKDSKAFLMETPEDYERTATVPGDDKRITLDDFVAWHNPPQENGQQPTTKWATRFDLGFSISVPVLEFSYEKVFNIEDDYAPYDTLVLKKAPTEAIYTDGCGLMNGAALSAIARQMGYEERPTAVQGRIGGAKGLWVLHPREQSHTGVPKIWIRASQRKIHYRKFGPGQLIFDLVQPPRVTLPSRLSRLTILNLSHNAVPTKTFVELMKETLDEEVRPLTEWTGPKAMPLLWRTVERVGGVAMKRALQHALGTERALGLSGRIREDGEDGGEDGLLAEMLQEFADGLQEEEIEALEDNTVALFRDQTTGEPLTKHAVVLDLIQAGFNPLRLDLLHDKLKMIVTDVIESVIQDFHISIPMSAEAFIVPDPCGVLEHGQIHFKSTKYLKDPLDDPNPHLLLGEVLIYRNPNRLPWDVQKVTAIEHEALSQYTDVIILPTKGPCSFASILAGGDYDGDVCVCIYDPRLVSNFKSSPVGQPPKDFLKDNFEDQGSIQQTTDMAAEMNALSNDANARRQRLQQSLLTGLATAPIGAYSNFHENSIYANGYSAQDTIRLALMFNTVLDSRKTGHKVKAEVQKQDKRKYDRLKPDCLRSSKHGDQTQFGNPARLKRNDELGRFVLDDLLKEGKKMRDKHLKRYEQIRQDFNKQTRYPESSLDDDLKALYLSASALAENPLFKSDFELMRDHIQRHIGMWQKLAREEAKSKDPNTPSRRGRGRGAAGAASNAKTRRAKRDELARSFAAGPPLPPSSPLAALGVVERLRASWAYTEKPKFAFSVAFGALCHLKAGTREPVAVAGEFADVFAISAGVGRVLEQSRLALYAAAGGPPRA